MDFTLTDEEIREMGFTFTDEEIQECRKLAFAAKPYRDDDEHYEYFDRPGDAKRERATSAIHLLKALDLWTEEDEKKAFG